MNKNILWIVRNTNSYQKKGRKLKLCTKLWSYIQINEHENVFIYLFFLSKRKKTEKKYLKKGKEKRR